MNSSLHINFTCMHENNMIIAKPSQSCFGQYESTDREMRHNFSFVNILYFNVFKVLTFSSSFLFIYFKSLYCLYCCFKSLQLKPWSHFSTGLTISPAVQMSNPTSIKSRDHLWRSGILSLIPFRKSLFHALNFLLEGLWDGCAVHLSDSEQPLNLRFRITLTSSTWVVKSISASRRNP